MKRLVLAFIALAFAFGFADKVGMVPLLLSLTISAAGLLVWAREKKIDVTLD